ncbi:serine/threonine-protein kinase [Runella slithyformis]|uniref:Serine/threonine protein kinase n=1 Tax=Runella slithyformis (strain ATCC 29530 / DSM 19594 / LMG 11500 / NCIMB 11436 / LSU 4) TaxID=761193 RepID=A0A7U3ZQH4_RUNSL|nr:serine/threonine-protein kinase [Runella slithyformis]AEI51495.1 serine/threonine protein kinase [Runella slithyformis DSM 19594]
MTAEEFYARFQFDPSMSGSLLGRGGFSSVHKVYDTVRKRYVAVKRSEVGVFQKFDLAREVTLAHEIDIHPNIIRYENVYRITDRAGVFDYAVMKYYAEGNLDDVLRKHELNDAARRQILTGILEGLAHLHRVPIIHRDFKTANILMDRAENGDWVPVIADFGLSRLVDADMSYVLNNSQIAHTPSYAAPEQLLDNVAIRPNTDLWAFGVMTYKMVMGRLPFRVDGAKGEWDTSNRIRSMILEGKLPADISTIQEPYKSIIRKCLIFDPEKRVKKAGDLLALLEKRTAASPPPASPEPPRVESSYGGKTKIHESPADPPKPSGIHLKEPPIKKAPINVRFPWEMSLLVASLFFVLWIFYWLATRSKHPVEDSKNPVASSAESAAPDTILKNSEIKELVKPADLQGSEEKKRPVAEPAKKKISSKSYLIIYTTYHNLRVYIDNVPQAEIARTGQKNVYELPIGEGTFFKVEYLVPGRESGLTTESDRFTVVPGQKYEVRYTEKIF